MSLYLTRTEHKNGFVNLRPIFELSEDYLMEINPEKFKPWGIIQITGTQNFPKQSFLENQAYGLFTLSKKSLYSLQQKDDGTKMIWASELLCNIKPVDSDFRIKEIIEIPSNLEFDKVSEWESISNVLTPITRYIYLSNSKFVAGPFFWQQDTIGYKFSPAVSTGSTAYIVNLYNIEELKIEPNIYEFNASKLYDDVNTYGRIRHLLFGTEKTLPKPIKQIDCISNRDLKQLVGNILSQDLDTRKERRHIKDLIIDLPDTEITDERKQRIKNLFNNSENIDRFMSYIPSLILNDEQSTEKIARTFFENENFKNDDRLISYVENVSGYKMKLANLYEKKEKLESKIETKKLQLDELSKVGSSISEKEKSELEEKIKSIQTENVRLNDKIKQYESLNMSIEELSKKEEELQNKLKVRTDDILAFDSNVENTIKNAYKKLLEHNFDGELANIIMQESSKCEIKNQHKELNENLEISKKSLKKSTIDNLDKLISFIHDELTTKANREIEKNDIVNILLCLSQGFITILAGEPGTGKTSLVNLIAKILGLDNKICTRYVEVSVEKGWTSRRDFIGYYNPLNKIFEAANKNLLKALHTLDYEATHNDNSLPYLVLLDEANLSQMEYYWADFMGLCDLDKPSRILSISEDIQINIPSTLKFVATINLDHTTEALSPRLIDRAWIVTLQSKKIDIEDFEESSINDEYPIISMDILKPLYDSSLWETDKLDNGITKKFNEIYSCFEEINVNFSPRIIGMIKHYCLAGKKYFDNKNTYAALDYAVAQKILPKINGYGDSYRKFIEKLIKECDNNSMPICNSILKTILQKGDSNMQYYQFFTR